MKATNARHQTFDGQPRFLTKTAELKFKFICIRQYCKHQVSPQSRYSVLVQLIANKLDMGERVVLYTIYLIVESQRGHIEL